MGLDPRQVLVYVVRPTLAHLGLPGGEAAEKLVMGTAAHESGGFRSIDQVTGPLPDRPGPAVGLWQMERLTFDDMWNRFLPMRPVTQAKVRELACPGLEPFGQLPGNLYFACAMCRIRYYERPFTLTPDPPPEQLARWWKVHYNSRLGKGREEDFLAAYRRLIAPLYN
jgi:hypothetical protein